MAGRSNEHGPSPHGFPARSLYVIKARPVPPYDHAMAQMPKHLARQVRLESDGVISRAGPLFDPGSDRPVGGVIAVRAESFEEAATVTYNYI